MKPLEALADAISQFEGWHPDSRSWRNRNPGNLRPYRADQPQDGQGYRTFDSLTNGWAALKQDLLAKFNGSHGLKRSDTIVDLLNVYAPAGDQNNPTGYAKFVCQMCSHTLGRKIDPSSTLDDFLGGSSPEAEAL